VNIFGCLRKLPYDTVLSNAKSSIKPIKQCCRPGIRYLFDSWIRDPGWVKKVRIRIRDPGMNNPDNISQSSEISFLVTTPKFFDADPGSGMEIFGSGIWDGKKSDPGSGMYISDPQHC
jgi:hypothetical protein